MFHIPYLGRTVGRTIAEVRREAEKKHFPLIPEGNPFSNPSFLNQEGKIIWSDSKPFVGHHSQGGVTLCL